MKSRGWIILMLVVLACGETTPVGTERNPPAPGFNLAGSDSEAIAWADSVMLAMGGRQAWDELQHLRWDFFGRRTLWWDKHNHRVRIEIPADSLAMVLDTETAAGQVAKAGQLVTDPALADSLLQRGRSIWINDSYWLVMPFKLKDSGVTLQYLGQEENVLGRPSRKLQLTFEEVGDTPQNKYHVWVGDSSHLVEAFAYFPKAELDTPAFVLPWRDYKTYGEVLLSGDRGTMGERPMRLENISVAPFAKELLERP